jgi:hypothetical protein
MPHHINPPSLYTTHTYTHTSSSYTYVHTHTHTQVRLTLQKLQAWHEWNQVVLLDYDEEPSLPDEILIVRFLQLMCEGHYLPNQDIMREQPNNAVSYNLLGEY